MIRYSCAIRTNGTGVRTYIPRIHGYGIGIGLYGIQNGLFLIKGPTVNTDHKIIAGIPANNIRIGDIAHGVGKIILKVGFYLHIVQGLYPNRVFFEFVRPHGIVAYFVLTYAIVLYVIPIDTPIHDLFGTDTVRGHFDMVVFPIGGNNDRTSGIDERVRGQVGNAPNFLTDIDPFGTIVIMYTSQVGIIDHGPG